MTTPKTALVAGASGLIGGFVLDRLASDPAFSLVVSIGRRKLDRKADTLVQHVVDFDRLDESASLLTADCVFCCLGTTIKTAGSKEAFRKVDHHYVAEIARVSRAQGASHFLLVSSIGTGPHALNFYNQVKADAEDAVRAAGFPSVTIARPSLLLGERAESRPGEAAAMAVVPSLNPLLLGPLRPYRAIEARTVADALVAAAHSPPQGVQVLTHDDLVALASRVPVVA